MTEDIMSMVKKHEQWRLKETINLIPSENVTSPAVRALLSSDFGHRYTSPDRFYMGTKFTDEIQSYGEKLAKDVFNSDMADLRPLSGHVADLIFLACFTKPKDKVIIVSRESGGYPGISEKGISTTLGLKTLGFPYSRAEMNIDTEKAADFIVKQKPRAVIFGASLFLFPHPVRQLAKIAKEVEATVSFDGSHVLGLIAGKQFQDPLREGADVLFGSTHKSFFGPQGGIMLADKEHGEIIRKKIHPAFVDNAHWNRVAALTLALAEMKEFGQAYAKQVVQNAQELAKAVTERGFPAVCAEKGFTKSHQVYLDFGGYKNGKKVAKKLEKANIIADSGVRLGVNEATHRGMRKAEMHRIAEFMERTYKKNENPQQVKKDVINFMKGFQEVQFCFK